MRQETKDTLARLRFERDEYSKRAIQRRKDATEMRRSRDFLGALQAQERAREYRNTAAQLAEEISKIRMATR